MMKILKNILFATALLMMAGCEKVVEFKIEDQEPMVVVNCHARAGEQPEMQVSMSRFFLMNSNNYPKIDNASCSMWFGSQEVTGVYDSEKDRYLFGHTVAEGDSLKVEVTVPGYETVKASTRVPMKVEPQHFRFIGDTTMYSYSDSQIRFVLHDRAGEKNYYSLRIKHVESYIYDDTPYTHEYDEYFTCSDLLIVDQSDVVELIGGMSGYDGNLLFFTDEHIDGQSHEIALDCTVWFPYDSTSRSDYYLVLESLSKEMYQYMTTKEAQYNGEDLGGLFGEAVQVYSNIQGGVGILGASSRSQKYIVGGHEGNIHTYPTE